MVRFTGGLLLFSALSAAAPRDQVPSDQHVLNSASTSTQKGNPRKLQGKILHITDVHPDPFYREGTDPGGEHPCHKGSGEAGYYGAEKTDCDAPFTLVNATFDWIKENVKDEIDFVIWTGDSARHDNDEKFPRTNKQVENLNRFVVDKFWEVFGKPDNINDPDPTNDFVVPIVPTYGNNDFLPHNIFTAGPNRWTRKYLEIWNKFVPQEQRHSFARGGWFFSEVIPNKLAVFSLNTMYFFDSNAAVDGCDDKSEPGYEHFEWLRIQLEFLRERGMKAILTGHVPPARTESKQNWDETCYQKWTLWQRQYRDVIVANIFGHMNVDHFMFQDVKDLKYQFKIAGIDDDLRKSVFEKDDKDADDGEDQEEDESFHISAKADYLNELRDKWSELPSPPKGSSYLTIDFEVSMFKKKKDKKKRKQFLKDIGGPHGERFSLSLVSPSVVPNFYPTLRIIEYNISGLEHDHPAMGQPVGRLGKEKDLKSDVVPKVLKDEQNQSLAQNFNITELTTDEVTDLKKKKHKKKKKSKKRKPNFPVPDPPSKSTPPGPAYSMQTFTFLSYTQYYSNLTKIHEAMKSELAETLRRLHEPEPMQRNSQVVRLIQEAMTKKHFGYDVEYVTNNDSMYKMPDLTIRSWLNLAEKIGRTEYKKKDAVQDTDEWKEYPTTTELNVVETQNGENGSESEIDIDKKKKHKKKKRKGKNSRVKKNHMWHTFVKRAFVNTKLEEELDDDFG